MSNSKTRYTAADSAFDFQPAAERSALGVRVSDPLSQLSVISPVHDSVADIAGERANEENCSATEISFRNLMNDYVGSAVWSSPDERDASEFFTSRFTSQAEYRGVEGEELGGITNRGYSSGIMSIKAIELLEEKKEMSERVLRYPLKSHRLAKPCLYEFDIYVRAATEIQRLARGFLHRRQNNSFAYWRCSAVVIQRAYRRYRERRNVKVKTSLDKAKKLQKSIISTLAAFNKVLYAS
eukprot:TRINITY_DN11111_c0_g1_i1.p1 TRINITY_DN11111_c0_g1~~TRINITY_DN11111_c0_g1_i1.p1  ORF type:complete len:239 (-),score=39.12 TRINITY_DN11111_c0_g1_i1:491-1207(-)